MLSVRMTTLFLYFRKYVQVCVQNLSELDFELSDSNLEDKGHATDLRLAPLNTQSQQVTVLCSEHQVLSSSGKETRVTGCRWADPAADLD